MCCVCVYSLVFVCSTGLICRVMHPEALSLVLYEVGCCAYMNWEGPVKNVHKCSSTTHGDFIVAGREGREGVKKGLWRRWALKSGVPLAYGGRLEEIIWKRCQ